MKYFVIGIIVLVLIIIICFFSFNKKTQISDIENFSFSYSKGYMANAYIRYNISCKEKCTATIKPYGVAEENAYELDISNDVMDEIKSLLIKYDVYKWNGFNKNDKNVLDGDSFNFYFKKKNVDKIEASGYMMWPKNYADVRNGLDSIFNKILEDNDIHTNN